MKFLMLFLFIAGALRAYETFYFDKGRKKGKIYANWTLLMIGLNYVLMIGCSIFEYMVFPQIINYNITFIAVILIIIRLLIKQWSVSSLGEFWSANVEIREGHQLIRIGPYKYMRHPVYIANLLDFIAMPLFLNSFYTILFILPIQIFIIQARIIIEEKELFRKFPRDFVKYKREAISLLPIKLNSRWI